MYDADETNYRETPYQHCCAICREPATQRCLQCARPYCQRHGPASAGQLCADCTLQLENTRAPVRSTKTGLSLTLGVGGAIAGALLGPLAVGVAFAGVVVTQGVGAVLERGLRRRFRRRRQLDSDDDFLIGEGPRIAAQGGPESRGKNMGVDRRRGGQRAMDVLHYRKIH